MKVCKFGGSSLSGPDDVRKVCDIVAADPERRLVVVSAPGRRDPQDAKVTDLLIAAAEHRLAGRPVEDDLRAVLERYANIQEGLGLPSGIVREIERDLDARLRSDTEHEAKFLDRVKAAGEDNGAKLIAVALSAHGLNARYLHPRDGGLLLSDEYGNARILPESFDRLAALREAPGITVFPGFFGCTPEGDVVTFPRGGSDITGSILAAAVHAELYENFTDVDSVCAVDPDLVPNVSPVAELSYREMRELSYAGFGVLHDEAILPAVRAGIPICIRNTHQPDAAGTMIVPERKHDTGKVVGIAYDTGFCTVFASKYLMNREIGFGRRFLAVFEDEGLSFEHMPSGVDNISIILREEAFDADTEQRVVERIRNDLGANNIYVERDLALIMLVGEGMRYSVGLAARAAQAFADARVNIEMINQGSSEISMMFGVKAADCKKAVRSLYRAFF